MTRTKIVATIGPASSSKKILRELILSGVDMIRLNFSHGSHKEHKVVIDNIRSVAERMHKYIPIMADLQGPKIRTGLLKDKIVTLKRGQKIILTIKKIKGDENLMPVDYKLLPKVVSKGMIILLNEGLVKLRVESRSGENIKCVILRGGWVGEHKGINILNIKLASSFTDKDKRDIKFAISQKVDYFALSFVRDKNDVELVKKFIARAGGDQPLIAKIEKPEAVKAIKSILQSADGVMVARGDLGVEGDLEHVPIWQKRIIYEANRASKIVITATQMLESMISAPMPTRAEVTDVSNAIFEGTCAVMLSGETAMGKYPVQTVKMMNRIISTAEKSQIYEYALDFFTNKDDSSTYSIAHAAINAAQEARVKGIIVLTMSGTTATFISKRRPKAKLFAFSPDPAVSRRMNAYWGVTPSVVEKSKNLDKAIKSAAAEIQKRKWLKRGDRVVVVYGGVDTTGGTDRMKIMRLGD